MMMILYAENVCIIPFMILARSQECFHRIRLAVQLQIRGHEALATYGVLAHLHMYSG